MSQTDPIADVLTRIRNAQAMRHEWVISPSSSIKKAMLGLLKDEGYINDYQVSRDGHREILRIRLRYDEQNQPVVHGLRRVSRPGLRVYVEKKVLPRFYGGRGVSILSTSEGVMSGKEAWRKGIGGELLCYVW